MAALTNARNTPEMADFGRVQVYPVEANTVIYLGAIVALNPAGNATPAASQAGLKIVGRAERLHNGIPGQNADNSGGAAGAISIVCRRGAFMYADNDNSITAAAIGELAYAVDDNSVSAGDGGGQTAVSNTTSFALPASPAAQIEALHANIRKGSFNAYSQTGGGGTHYVEGTDYSIDYDTGLFTALPAGAIPAGGTVFVAYNYGAPTRSAAGTIVNLDPSGEVWVDFWRQSQG